MSAHIVIMTGAGISADSGVQTFRDTGGLWEGHRPEDVATPEAWARDRTMVWRFYQARRRQLRTVEPNAAHTALAAFERKVEARGASSTLVTQNVDDLHDRAGSDPLHMHGEISVLRCEACWHRTRDLEHVEGDTFVACEVCGHDAMRPDVVWFGEMPHHLDAIDSAMARCTHFLAIGTSGSVWPAAGFLQAARFRGARTWVQSLDAPDNLASIDVFRPGRASEVLPGLLEEIARELGL